MSSWLEVQVPDNLRFNIIITYEMIQSQVLHFMMNDIANIVDSIDEICTNHHSSNFVY